MKEAKFSGNLTPEGVKTTIQTKGQPQLANLLRSCNGEQKYLLDKIVVNNNLTIIYKRFAVSVENAGLTKESATQLLARHGLERDSPAVDLAKLLSGDVFEQIAYLHLNNELGKQNYRVINPAKTARVFKEWREKIIDDKERFGVMPDGIVVEIARGKTYVIGFSEYTLSPHIALIERDQLKKLQNVIGFLFEDDNRWVFLKSLKDSRPEGWPEKFGFRRPADLKIFYVIPKDRFLPPTLAKDLVVAIRVPFTWSELDGITKTLAGDYFEVEIK